MTIRPIRTDADYQNALADIDHLFDAPPGSDDADRLEVLTILVAAYEAKTHPMPAPSQPEALAFIMQAQGRSQADLAGVLGSRSRASEIINQRRGLSAEMIDRIARAWAIPAALLGMPQGESQGTRVARRATGLVARGVAGVLLAATLTGGGALWWIGRGLPDVARLATLEPANTAFYDDDNRLVERRIFTPLAAIPPHIVKAFLAAEDDDFYAHRGIDLNAVGRAALHNALHRGDEAQMQGAATITQQVVKNLLLTGQPRSLDRKIREAILAWRLEAVLPKERILELYLNHIYFGGGSYGVAAAAEQYFGKPLTALSVAEAAYLAALPKAPNHYRITAADNIERAKIRRDWVLERMSASGYIPVSAAVMARAESLAAPVR